MSRCRMRLFPVFLVLALWCGAVPAPAQAPAPASLSQGIDAMLTAAFTTDQPGAAVTIEHLLTHTSGIQSYTDVPGWMSS